MFYVHAVFVYKISLPGIQYPGVMILKIQWKTLILCLAVPLAVGGLAALLTKDSMSVFASVNKPALSPPGWLFPVVWTILYVLMGTASYLIVTSGKDSAKALRLYGIQLVFNFFWPLLFFCLEQYLLSFLWLVVLWFLILGTAASFFTISRTAGYLMIPYLLWVTFAGYLNFFIWLLN